MRHCSGVFFIVVRGDNGTIDIFGALQGRRQLVRTVTLGCGDLERDLQGGITTFKVFLSGFSVHAKFGGHLYGMRQGLTTTRGSGVLASTSYGASALGRFYNGFKLYGGEGSIATIGGGVAIEGRRLVPSLGHASSRLASRIIGSTRDDSSG